VNTKTANGKHQVWKKGWRVLFNNTRVEVQTFSQEKECHTTDTIVTTIINTKMKEFFAMYKDLWLHSVDLWKNDRKEFWELYGSLALVTFWMWFSFFVLIPIFGD
jgi:fructosamine-3-kinase